MAGLISMRHRGLIVAGCLAALAVMMGGCGKSLPEVIPVRGAATLAGKPVVLMDVVLHPLPGTQGSGAVGRTGTDGRFEMVAVVGGETRVLKGARPGRYRVAFAEPDLYAPDGTPQPRPKSAGTVAIPQRYMDPTASPLEVEVIAGMPELILDVPSK
jgi:hypothetical protein